MSAWFQKLFKKEASQKDASFVEKCEENPTGARAYLAQDQARLGKEIEDMYAAYDARLRALAGRVKTLSEEDLAREMESIRSAQDDLRRIVRRFQAALKSTDELDRELDGWEGHPDDQGGLHADHPLVRSEIIRSELALRDEDRLRQSKSPKLKPVEETIPYSLPVSSVIPSEVFHVQVHEVDPVHIPDEASLIAAIRDAVRETNRWHALDLSQHTQDAVDQVRQMQQLHAILKRLDRQQGIRRDRSDLWPEIR